MADASTRSLELHFAARSDRGLVRSGNQDSVYAGPRLLAVADGMGGAAAGDVASSTVIATLAPLDEELPDPVLVDGLRRAVDRANDRLRDTVDANPEMEGMGTTLTAMLVDGGSFAMVHIGDSRAYRIRDGVFAQITKDDTYVQLLVDEGRIKPEEAQHHPHRSMVSRVLQGLPTEPAYTTDELALGDKYLICSDGLSNVVSASTIEATMRGHADPDGCAERLVELALRAGAPDNVSVIVAFADGAERPPMVDIPTAEVPLVDTAGDLRPVSPGPAAAYPEADAGPADAGPATDSPEAAAGSVPRRRLFDWLRRRPKP